MAVSKKFKLLDKKNNLASTFSDIKSHRMIAVDCEGVDLSRKGELTVLAVATEEKTYIFDVFKLGQYVFDAGLRDILEDKSIEKLMFDCRQDSDSLWHHFKVKLRGVLDLQLLDIIYRRENSGRHRRAYRTNRRWEKEGEVEYINGYRRCISNYVYDTNLLQQKDKGIKEIKENNRIWRIRPLSDTLLDYCTVDVAAMFPMFKKLKHSDDVLPRLRVASDRYADIWRSMEVRSFDKFELNPFLPLDIIPEDGNLTFPFGSTKCTKCQRKFPHDEFRDSQLRDGTQACRVCRKVLQR